MPHVPHLGMEGNEGRGCPGRCETVRPCLRASRSWLTAGTRTQLDGHDFNTDQYATSALPVLPGDVSCSSQAILQPSSLPPPRA